MKKIAIAGFQHETNTFCPFPTRLADFEVADSWPGLTKGDAIIDVFPPLNIPIGGFISSPYSWQLVPIIWASAEPAGPVSSEAFEAICKIICEGVRKASPLDGVYLDLHGAMVTDEFEDGEAEIVRRVRTIICDSMPLVCSLDFHANISPEFVEQTSAIVIFRHYPHTDMATTGARAAQLMDILLRKGRPLYKAFKQVDYLVPLSSQGTTHYPFNQIYAGFDKLQNEEVLSVDAAAGFPAADIWNSGPAVVAYGTDQAAVDHVLQNLYQRFVDSEGEIVDLLLTPQSAVEKATNLINDSPMPVVLADVQDNPGAGGTCDTTAILETLIAEDSSPAIVGVIYDPGGVEKAWQVGMGRKFELSIGNAYPIEGTTGFIQRYIVEQISDSPVQCTGTMYRGWEANLGAMALLRVDNTKHDIRLIVASVRFQCLDLALFRHMGISIEQPQIIVVKSTVHFLADFQPIAQQVLFVEAPGVHPCILSHVDYKNLRPGVRIGPMGDVRK